MTLDRLEKKGLLSSYQTEPTSERGGRARRCYRVTKPARAALRESRRALAQPVGRVGREVGAVAMLRWLTDASLADSIAGDLEEQRRQRARSSPGGGHAVVLARVFGRGHLPDGATVWRSGGRP